jgi:hypothetical protein
MRFVGAAVWILTACLVGSVGGYYVADHLRAEEIARLTQDRDSSFIREHELKAQLTDALAARAALAHEAQQLQENLSERLKRLEDVANQLTSEDKQRQEGRGE